MFLALGILGALFTTFLIGRALRPLFEQEPVAASEWERLEDESSDLVSRRDRLVAELRELEFEAASGKLAGADLTGLRARFEAEALDLSRRLDERIKVYADRLDDGRSS